MPIQNSVQAVNSANLTDDKKNAKRIKRKAVLDQLKAMTAGSYRQPPPNDPDN